LIVASEAVLSLSDSEGLGVGLNMVMLLD